MLLDDLIVEIPGTIPKELSPNARPNRYDKARATRERRETAGYATMGALAGREMVGGPLELHIEVAWEIGRQIHDDDNIVASLKAIQDGIADGLRRKSDRGMTIVRPVLQTFSGDTSGRVVVWIRSVGA